MTKMQEVKRPDVELCRPCGGLMNIMSGSDVFASALRYTHDDVIRMMRFFILATAILALFSAAAAAAPEPIATQQILGAHIVAANGAPIGRVSDL
ncbi:MAG TPA: hypothetical protein VKV32_05680, partial [Stellaceae bacterium]|nr:hypothetical protein [Stellaceae bacterium]